MLDLNTIRTMSTTVQDLDAEAFLALYNELSGTDYTDLASVINGMKLVKLTEMLQAVAAPVKTSVSKWDRNTAEGKAANCEASKKSREKKKLAELAEKAKLQAELDELKQAK